MKRFLGFLPAMLLLVAPVQGQNFSQLYVFGDSMSDMGNIFAATSGITPAPPFVDGRFSNGPVYVEGLAEVLGLAPLQPSNLGGTNFAWAGAKAADDISLLGGLLFLPSVQTQVASYLSTLAGGAADGDGLYVVFGGNSDIDLGLEEGLDGTSGEPMAKAAAAGIVAAVGQLAAAGAGHILVINVPDIGITPQHVNSAGASQLSVLFNEELAAGLAGIDGADIKHFDIFTFLNEQRSNFLVNDAQCFNESTGEVCDNPEDYLFFDDFHPTQNAHRVLALGLAALYQDTAISLDTWGAVKRGFVGF